MTLSSRQSVIIGLWRFFSYMEVFMNNSMAMMEEARKPGVPSMLETQLGSIAEGIQRLADVCKSQQDMLLGQKRSPLPPAMITQ